MVPVRLFFDFLMEEGVREANPGGRGRYTPGNKPESTDELTPLRVSE
jgi:hypothetical protein